MGSKEEQGEFGDDSGSIKKCRAIKAILKISNIIVKCKAKAMEFNSIFSFYNHLRNKK